MDKRTVVMQMNHLVNEYVEQLDLDVLADRMEKEYVELIKELENKTPIGWLPETISVSANDIDVGRLEAYLKDKLYGLIYDLIDLCKVNPERISVKLHKMLEYVMDYLVKNSVIVFVFGYSKIAQELAEENLKTLKKRIFELFGITEDEECAKYV